MSVLEEAKKHPAAAVGILALGLLVLYVLMSGSGGGSAAVTTSGPDAGLQAAELAAGTAFAQAQLGAASEDRKTDAAVKIAQLQADYGLQAKTSDNATYLQARTSDNSVATTIANLQAGIQGKSIDAQSAQSLAQLKQVSDIAAITSAVNLAGIAANRDTSIHSTDALATTQQLQSKYNFQVQDEQIAAARHKDNNSFLGDIIGGIGSFFGGLF